jgi:hypothetical protein
VDRSGISRFNSFLNSFDFLLGWQGLLSLQKGQTGLIIPFAITQPPHSVCLQQSWS